MEHLSDLALDALSGSADAADPHLAECARCRERLESFRQARAQAAAAPRFRELQESLPARTPNRWLAPALGFALAAGLAAVVMQVSARAPVASRERLKGSARVAVVPLDREGPRFHPGQRVQLRVGGAGHRYALVVGRDEHGQVSQVWPTANPRSGEIEPGADVPLAPAFEVTPGALQLVALFSDAPLSAVDVLDAWRVAGGDAPPPITGEAARAETPLKVGDAT